MMVLHSGPSPLSAAPRQFGHLVYWAVTISHASTMFISRLVAEEHYYWYFASFMWVAFLALKRVTRGHRHLGAAWMIGLQLLSQHLNPDGTQSLVATYIDSFLSSGNHVLIWVLVFTTYASGVNTIAKGLGMGTFLSVFASSGLFLGAIIFKLCSTHSFNPELLVFAPAWLHGIISRIDPDYSFRILRTTLVACFSYLLVRSRYSPGVSKKSR